MERWRICPDCRSDNMRCDIGVASRSTDPRFANILIYGQGVFVAKAVPVDTFICGDCGSIRTYVSDEGVLQYINDHWPRVDTLAAPEEEAVRQRLERELQSRPQDEYGD